MKRDLQFEWVDVDFRPSALADWRAVYLDTNAEHGHFVQPLAGWLIQEERAYYRDTQEPAEHLDPSRRVVPACCDGTGDVSDATESFNFWCVFGPGQPMPTAEAEISERERRALQQGRPKG
jgi:hypothetical protein